MENIEKMNYEEFKRELKKRVQEKADDGVEVKIVILAKKNQTKSENLAYKGDGFNLLPSIRLQEFYQRYQELGMDWCVEAAASVLENAKRVNKDQLIGDWESAEKRIVMELVNQSWNQELLETMPYRTFLDLAVIYRLKLWEDRSGDVVHAVTNEMMKNWHITETELYAAAYANLWKEDFEITGLVQATDELMEIAVEKEQGGKVQEWGFVFSNQKRVQGSIAMLRTDLLEAFAKEQKKDLFILPSSVHDVVLVPAAEEENVTKLCQIVRKINQEMVKPEDRLSDEVYYFRRSTGAVEVVSE